VRRNEPCGVRDEYRERHRQWNRGHRAHIRYRWREWNIGDVAAVTLIIGGMPADLVFCGNQQNQIPVNQVVTVTYNPGTGCATLVSVKGP
jgi:hypothetical protein